MFKILLITILFVCKNSDAVSFRQKRGLFIADGTKWCGAGTEATTCDDLGEYQETDKCCREHDYCPYSFSGNDEKFNGYYWNGFYSTLSSCECDKKFYDCLSKIGTETGASFVKSAFFEGLKIRCFSYVPCINDTTNAKPFIRAGLRRYGDCVDGFRVRVFDSFEEYDDYIENQLDNENKIRLAELLQKNSDKLMMDRKKFALCVDSFSYMTEYIAQSYENSFLKNRNLVQDDVVQTVEEVQTNVENVADIFGQETETTESVNASSDSANSLHGLVYDGKPIEMRLIIFFLILTLVIIVVIGALLCVLIPHESKPTYLAIM